MVRQMIVETNRKVNFGVYRWQKQTAYGERTHGQFKGYNIDIYHDKRDNTKLYYVSDQIKNWIKSKLEYYQNGIKKIIYSENGRL